MRQRKGLRYQVAEAAWWVAATLESRVPYKWDQRFENFCVRLDRKLGVREWKNDKA